MQTIPQTYKQAQQTMSLMKREGLAVMYSNQSKTYFEVHVVRVMPPREAFGKQYPEREVLAGNEDFGSIAWACSTQTRAEDRFKEITSQADT